MLVSTRRFSSDFSHHRDRSRLVAAVGWSLMFDPSVLQEQFKFQHWLFCESSPLTQRCANRQIVTCQTGWFILKSAGLCLRQLLTRPNRCGHLHVVLSPRLVLSLNPGAWMTTAARGYKVATAYSPIRHILQFTKKNNQQRTAPLFYSVLPILLVHRDTTSELDRNHRSQSPLGPAARPRHAMDPPRFSNSYRVQTWLPTRPVL